ncbi:MAG TPA: hypothetical protein VM012_09345 [Flavitalea sp.]|nr:hypothetical protein [Flavitalea sp.]
MTRVFLPVLMISFLAGCKKEDKFFVKDGTNAAENVKPMVAADDVYYFKAIINGQTISWVVPAGGKQGAYESRSVYTVSQLSDDCTDNLCRYFLANTVISSKNSTGIPQITAGFNIATKNADKKDLQSWFEPGIKVFGTPRSTIADVVKNGVFIYYIDSDKKEWVSHFGSGDQSGSFFESVDLTNGTQVNEGSVQKRWKARFSCKLYSREGKSISVENGEIYGPVL